MTSPVREPSRRIELGAIPGSPKLLPAPDSGSRDLGDSFGALGASRDFADEPIKVDGDLVLMNRLRDGCKESLGILLERYWLRLVHYISHIVGSGDEAEDIAQETFIRVWSNRRDWEPSGSVSGFLYSIARNLSLNAVRDRKARFDRQERSEHRAWSSVRDPHEVFLNRSLQKKIQAAVDELPPRRREVFILSRYHGLSHKEIAQAMDLAVSTVSNQMTSAMKDLREILEPLLTERSG